MPSDEWDLSERRETRGESSARDEGERPGEDATVERDAQAATRGDPAADLPPEDYPGTPEEWSSLSNERRRIVFFSLLPVEDRDPSILVPSGNRAEDPGGVSEATCAEIRTTMKDATTAREVVETYNLHTSKVMRHAYGGCSHDPDVSPTASPQIGPDECLSMRDDYRTGDDVSTIASEWSRSENTVTRHVFGRCSHAPDPRDVSASEVTVEECRRLREAFRDNEQVGVREAAVSMRLAESPAARHISDFCDHSEPETVGTLPGDDLFSWDGRDA